MYIYIWRIYVLSYFKIQRSSLDSGIHGGRSTTFNALRKNTNLFLIQLKSQPQIVPIYNIKMDSQYVYQKHNPYI